MKPTSASYRLICVPVNGRAVGVIVAVVETLCYRCGTSGLSTVCIRIRKRRPRTEQPDQQAKLQAVCHIHHDSCTIFSLEP